MPKRLDFPSRIANANLSHLCSLVFYRRIEGTHSFENSRLPLCRISQFLGLFQGFHPMPLLFRSSGNWPWSLAPTNAFVKLLSRLNGNNSDRYDSRLIHTWPMPIHLGKWKYTKIPSRLKRSPFDHGHRTRTEWRCPRWICHIQRGGKRPALDERAIENSKCASV
jgi:hypothetical protein